MCCKSGPDGTRGVATVRMQVMYGCSQLEESRMCRYLCTSRSQINVLSAYSRLPLRCLCRLPWCWLLTFARSYVSVSVAYLGNRRSLRAAMCLHLPRCKYFHRKVTCVHIFCRLADCYFVRSCTLLSHPVQFCILYHERETDMGSPSSAKHPSVFPRHHLAFIAR